ncbi:MAG TPA: sigma 54-interacting transcriptional regulator [Terriglobales bacterium]|nr:sigma 54-interacting transcriptional regulator [Terriglobales bacterium]
METFEAPFQVDGVEPVVRSELMKRLLQMVERVARSNAAVLISGETGSGKEFVARALHHYSLRSERPWVDVNCAALPEHLVESELFGYEKGAFSGADSTKPGLFELADKGTLFLDEVGELEPRIQVKLLRVLDGIAYFRLGGSKKVSVDVRIIAATNQDLEQSVRTGRFRSDLYHRLGQIQLKIPPLRDRLEDLEALSEVFLKQQRPEFYFSHETQQALRAYSWPGNIRELRNITLQIAMSAAGPEIKPADLPPDILQASTKSGTQVEEDDPGELDEVERLTILKALARTGGHQGLAAEQLGISRRTLSRKLKLYNLQAERRQQGEGSLGKLGPEQQHYFRAEVEVPIRIRNCRGREVEGRTLNMSSGGVAVHGIENPLEFSGPLEVRFAIPDSNFMVETKSRIAWADVERRAGLKFVDISTQAQGLLDRWLAKKQKEEGWAVEAV